MQLVKILILILLVSNVNAQLEYYDEDQKHLWGPISIQDLLNAPYLSWYTSSDSIYNPDLDHQDYSPLKDVHVKIFLGTWCGDTKNYLPKFLKLWKSAGLPIENLELIAVHNSDAYYKQGPNHEEKPYGLHRVPTFIFEKNSIEMARIVEHPITSLEIDLAQIAAQMPPAPAYRGVTLLQKHFEDLDQDSLNPLPAGYLNRLFSEIAYVGELTTYAKKLDADGLEKYAEFVYEINTRIFPYHPYSYYRYGIFLFEKGRYEEARQKLYKTIAINPGYMNACKYVVDIESELSDQHQ